MQLEYEAFSRVRGVFSTPEIGVPNETLVSMMLTC